MKPVPTPAPRISTKDVDRSRFAPFLLSAIANKFSRGSSRLYLRMFGVGIIEWRILRALADQPDLAANQLCQIVDLDKAAVSRSLRVLERLGCIRTTADLRDARKRVLVLTPAGGELHDRMLEVALERERRLLAGLSEEERAQLLDLLGRLHANATEMNLQEPCIDPSGRDRPTGCGC